MAHIAEFTSSKFCTFNDFFFHFLGLNWSFKSNSFLPKIGVKRGGGRGVRKKRRREEKKERGLGREERERLL